MELALVEAVERHGGAADRLVAIEKRMTEPDVVQDALDANEHPPRLVDPNTVEFHPAWHRLLDAAREFGLHAAAWTSGAPAAHLERAAGFYLWSQVEAGHGCPISMTYAAVPALRVEPELAAEWTPRLAADALAGMTMTEKQGGSDLRTVQTRAEPAADGTYALTGEKWFCSAPMCDAFLVLAQAPAGPTCFLVPRQPEMRIVKLKEKLGNRSNASSEVEFDRAVGHRVGEEGRGLATILEAVSATRLDCVLGSTSLMRRALVEAIDHTRTRSAFGGLLFEKPLMRSVLADLALEQEAALTLGLRLASAVDADERALLRLALPAAKYSVCKRTPGFVAEALECFGGNGYTSDSPMPYLFKESPLNSIWEGSANIQALDVLRAIQREPDSLDAYLAEVGPARGADPHLDRAIEDILTSLADLSGLEARARRLAEQLAVVLQGALLTRYAPAEVASAYCASRLGRHGGLTYGVLPRDTDVTAILERASH